MDNAAIPFSTGQRHLRRLESRHRRRNGSDGRPLRPRLRRRLAVRLLPVRNGRLRLVDRLVLSLPRLAVHSPANIDDGTRVLGTDDRRRRSDRPPADAVAENPHVRSGVGDGGGAVRQRLGRLHLLHLRAAVHARRSRLQPDQERRVFCRSVLDADRHEALLGNAGRLAAVLSLIHI